MRWGLLVVALQLAACVQSESKLCASGITCPSDNTCDDAHIRCLSPDQIAECAGKPDGTACSFSGADGSCKASVCELFDCGNGIKEPGEQCDGTDFGTDDCTTFGYYFPQGLSCNPDCSFDRSACGGTCGDGAKNGNEQCDGTQLDRDCTAFGYYKSAGLTCSSCQFDTTACQENCGDGIKNGPELCDGAPPLETCVGIGFDAGKLLCSTTGCTFALDSCSRFNWRRENVPLQSWVT
ncbi:MAG TPA: hypothetical protein VL326_30780, partial [Kofleriaceae bacterium]|nr:hypothetical protein [Kofleriaceae bacterium]